MKKAVCARSECEKTFIPRNYGKNVRKYCSFECRRLSWNNPLGGNASSQLLSQRKHIQKNKKAAYQKLGNRCSSLNCLWVNEDGTKGCIDVRCLQIDHVKGDGAEDFKKGIRNGSTPLYKAVLADTDGRYQLLCANCNWIKRHVNKEVPKLYS